jgi:hypothetical protein
MFASGPIDSGDMRGGKMRDRRRQWRLAGPVAAVGMVAATVLVHADGPALAAVPGLVRISKASVSNSATFKDATATCPAGKILVGAGGRISGGLGEVTFDDIRPNGSTIDPPTAVTVRGHESDPFTGNWAVTAFAVCANPIPGAVRIAATSPSDSATFKDVTAACPAGKVLTGTGAEITDGIGEVVFDDIRPNGNTIDPPTAVTVRGHETEAFANSWRVTAYAICVNALPGLVRIPVTSASNSLNAKSITAFCPTGKRLVGTGAEITDGIGEVVVTDFRPSGDAAIAPSSVTVAAEEEDPFAGNWRVTAYAVCADV